MNSLQQIADPHQNKLRTFLNECESLYRSFERKCAIERKSLDDIPPDAFIQSVIQKLCKCFGTDRIRQIQNDILDLNNKRMET